MVPCERLPTPTDATLSRGTQLALPRRCACHFIGQDDCRHRAHRQSAAIPERFRSLKFAEDEQVKKFILDLDSHNTWLTPMHVQKLQLPLLCS